MNHAYAYGGLDLLLATILAGLGRSVPDTRGELTDAAAPDAIAEGDLSPAELITRGLLVGEGRYTRLEVAERAHTTPEEARRLWRAPVCGLTALLPLRKS